MNNLTFKRISGFLGRNGNFKSKGINFLKYEDSDLHIRPITTKDMIGRCEITIPKEDIAEFAAEVLKFAYMGNETTCPKCGGKNVEMKAWVNPNTGEFKGFISDNMEINDYWCNDCSAHFLPD